LRIVLLAAAALCVMGACTETPRESGRAAPAATGLPPGSVARSRIFVDPATGQPREPTAEELAAAARDEAPEQSARRAKPLAPREVEYPNGAVAVILGDEALHPLQACIRPDGSVEEMCGHGDAPVEASAQHAPGTAR
jgi:hypothetical protein